MNGGTSASMRRSRTWPGVQRLCPIPGQSQCQRHPTTRAIFTASPKRRREFGSPNHPMHILRHFVVSRDASLRAERVDAPTRSARRLASRLTSEVHTIRPDNITSDKECTRHAEPDPAEDRAETKTNQGQGEAAQKEDPQGLEAVTERKRCASCWAAADTGLPSEWPFSARR